MSTKASLILGLALMAGAALLGKFHYDSRQADETIRVVGAATQSITSDIIKWRVSLARTVAEEGLSAGYAQIRGDVESVVTRLRENGIEEGGITIQSVNTYPQYDRNGVRSGYNIQQQILIISKSVEKIEALAFDPGQILSGGIRLENSYVEYFSSDLAGIKRDLLKAAVEDAQRRAQEIASGGGVTITTLAAASVGVFQITEPFSTEVSDYGVHSTSTRQKDITVTVRATYRIR
ncbi:MAG: SIMPL domain-containing protein [Candidatus Zixiibacteriota bacterium]